MSDREDLRDQLRVLVRDLETGGEFADATLNTLIDEAVNEIHEIFAIECEGNWGYTTEDVNVVNGTELYTGPTDSLKVIAYEWYGEDGSSAFDMGWIPFKDRHTHKDTSLTSVYRTRRFKYYEAGTQFGVVPVPTVTVTGGIKVHYLAEHGGLANDDASPTFPPQFHYLAVYRAAMHVMQIDEESAHWVATEWNRGTRRIRTKYKRQSRHSRHIRPRGR